METTCKLCGKVAWTDGDDGAVRCRHCGRSYRHGPGEDRPGAGSGVGSGGADGAKSVWVTVAVVVAFASALLPIWGTEHARGWRPRWPWELFRDLPTRSDVGLVLPAVFALAVAALAWIDPRSRPLAWVVTASVTSAIWIALGDGAFPIEVGPGVLAALPVVVTALAIATIAATSDLLARDPASRRGAFVTAGAGLAVFAAFLLPLERSRSWVGLVVDDALPDTFWPIVIAGIGVLVLAGLAVAQVRPAPHEGLRRATRGLVWFCALLVPVAFVVGPWLDLRGASGFFLSGGVKSFGGLFAVCAVYGAGLRRQLLPTGVSAGAPPGRTSSDPVEALRARLARLDRARDEGLLTPEEYAAQRARIVDRARF
ncbi:MAG: SHOCT domain-containing protein [Planctomycetia bacterium]|nr:SHOCT domain-containing protein [Planctomycetia bacterium]